MKVTRCLFLLVSVLVILLTISNMAAIAEAVLTMPASLQIIDEEAFYGSTSIDKIVLSDKVTEIRTRAFANSTLSQIFLPDSLTFIDDAAFDGPEKLTITANPGSYAYEWAVQKGYIVPEAYPESEHPYESDQEYTWSYTYPVETEYLSVTFSDETSFASDDEFESCDKFTITDGSGEPVHFALDELSGTTVFLKGNSFDLFLEAYPAYPERYEEGYGFKITSIKPASMEEYEAYWSSYEFFTRELQDGTLMVYGFKGPGRDIVIPDMINGKVVAELGYRAFAGTNIRSVKLPNTIRYIEMFAFAECEALSSIAIPDSVEYIGLAAFDGCIGLTEISISGHVETDEDIFTWDSFEGGPWSEKLKRVIITDGGTNLDIANVFRAFRNLEEYIVSDDNESYSTIDGVLFDKVQKKLISCPSGRSGIYTVPDGVTAIGDRAFTFCEKLTKVIIPDSVTSLGNNLFGKCSHLTDVTLPAGVTSIGNSMFYNCDSLTTFVIPDGVTNIGNSAFGDCNNLTKVTIPLSVIRIGDNAFRWCSDSFAIYGKAGSVAETYALQNEIAFVADGSVFTVINGVITDYNGGSGTIIIPSNDFEGAAITAIGEDAFSGMAGPLSIIVSEGIEEIQARAFTDSGLFEIRLPDSMNSIDNTAFDGPDRVAILANEGSYGYTWAATRGYTGYKEFERELLSDGTLSITKYTGTAEDVFIPSSIGWVAVTDIGNSAFFECNDMKSVTIPGSITSIGDDAFYGCANLTEIEVASDNPCYTSFEGVLFNKEKTEILVVPLGINGSLTIPDGVTSIDDWTFENCGQLTYVAIPDSVLSIGTGAFCGCNNLTSMTIPGSVTTIDSATFERCSSLTSITIPDSVTEIGWSAFESCSSLISITIPDSVTEISGEAFKGCSSLTSITIPESVTFIDHEAFGNCNEDLVIYGKPGSAADVYAAENGIAFEALL